MHVTNKRHKNIIVSANLLRRSSVKASRHQRRVISGCFQKSNAYFEGQSALLEGITASANLHSQIQIKQSISNSL
jgi:hypothetical protein